MYDYALVKRSFALTATGLTDKAVAERLGVSVRSVRHWRYGTRQRLPPESRTYGHNRRLIDCPRCGSAPLARPRYAYLLGLYLGDGHIVDKKRQHTLSITCADAWPGLMDECESAMTAVMPHTSVFRRGRKGCHDITASSVHWTCLFPQHGPGRKHERPIVLEDWQREIVAQFPERFIRGLIHSDGCRVDNVAVRTRGGKTTRHYYSRYHFTNESPHIRDLFTQALDRLGVEWRYNNRNCVSIAKRESVRRLDSFVGPKY